MTQDTEQEPCGLPGCDRPQEFETDEARCISHSLEWYFLWTPLAEFGGIKQ